MEAKKERIACKNCGEEMVIDFNMAQFSSEIRISNGKKQQKRSYFQPCPACHTLNVVQSENKVEWGNRKGPNLKFFFFSSIFSCLMVFVLGIVALFFAFKGLVFVMDWLFN